MVDVVQVLNKADLISVTAEESTHFLVVHGTVNGTLGNLEPIDVNNGNDSAGLGGVNVLVSVPSTSVGTNE